MSNGISCHGIVHVRHRKPAIVISLRTNMTDPRKVNVSRSYKITFVGRICKCGFAGLHRLGRVHIKSHSHGRIRELNILFMKDIAPEDQSGALALKRVKGVSRRMAWRGD